MEYADNGDLYQKIVEHQKKGILFAEQDIWTIFFQVDLFPCGFEAY
jgi:NIMA (never in mitosis gene a)-related kinase